MIVTSVLGGFFLALYLAFYLEKPAAGLLVLAIIGLTASAKNLKQILIRPKDIFVPGSSTRNPLTPTVPNPLDFTADTPVDVIRDTSGGRATYNLPPVPERLTRAVWVAPGSLVEIAGFRVTGGFIYVGETMRDPRGLTDVSLINPTLPVRNEGIFLERQTMFWHSYVEASPKARLAYLTWLTGERNDPNADTGFLFWYLYGLERRVIFDLAQQSDTEAESAQIAQELRRLLSLYGSRSVNFREYVSELLALAEGSALTLADAHKPVPSLSRTWKFPLYLDVAMGHCVKAGQPLPSSLAFAWVHYSPTVPLKGWVKDVLPALKELFNSRYVQSWGEGMLIDPPANVLKQSYRACSPSFRSQGDLEFSFSGVPRVTVRLTEFYALKELFETCVADLTAYAKAVVKQPSKRDALETVALFPPDFVSPIIREAARTLQEYCEGEVRSITIEALAKLAGAAEPPLQKPYFAALSKVLDLAGLAVAPNLPSKAETSEDLQTICWVYPWSKEHAPSGPVLEDWSARVLCLQAGLGMVGRNVSVEELAPLAAATLSDASPWASIWMGLTARRAPAKPSKAQFLKHYTGLSTSVQDQVLLVIQRQVVTGPDVPVEDLRLLEKLYHAVNKSDNSVYSAVHSTQTESSLATSPKLDFVRIQQLQEETAQVGALLAPIFEDPADAPVVCLPTAPLNQGTGPLAELRGKLRPEQVAFFDFLITRAVWDRVVVEAKSRELNLMLEGVLEALNELCFDTYDAPLFEGDDPLELSFEILNKLNT